MHFPCVKTMWLLTFLLWFVFLFCDLRHILDGLPKSTNHIKWDLCFGGIGVNAHNSNFITVQIGPTYQDDGIFGLHALLLYVQAFPEAQTAVEFWTQMPFKISEILLQAAFWVWTSYPTALHSLTITPCDLSECVAKTIRCQTGSSIDNTHGGWLRHVWLVSGQVQSVLRFAFAFCGLRIWSDCSDGKA